jgi:hypothetical protein
MSLFWRGNILGAVAGNSVFIEISYTNTDTSPFVVFAMGVDSGGTIYQMNVQTGGTFQFNNGGSVSTGMHSMCGTANWSGGAGSGQFYLDGSSLFTIGITAGTPTSASSELSINGLHAVTTRNTNSTCNIGAIWNRVLTPTEALWLHLDPYSFIIPADPDFMLAGFPVIPPVFVLMPQIIT